MQIVRRAVSALGILLLAFGLATSAGAAQSATPKGLGFSNATALWWKSPAGSEAGWGINFSHQGNIIFATWFTYDSDKKPQWFIAQLEKTGDRVYSGPISRVTGPPFNSVPFPAGATTETEVGNATVTFSEDGQTATFAYTVNGVSQTKTITPQTFADPVPTCSWGENTNLAAATNFQGLWWAAPAGSESGWGINFTHQGNLIFATWFTYDANGKPWWLIALLTKTGNKTYTGEVSTVSAPSFDAVPWDTGAVHETVVGTATLTFTDGNHGSFAYTVNGISQTKQITQQVFSGGGTACTYPDNSASYVTQLVDLASRAKSGAITGAQFADELAALLATIDNIDGAVDQLKAYLEVHVVGHAITITAAAAAGNRAQQKGLMISTFDEIELSEAFRLLEAAVASTTFFASAVNGNFINAPDPATLTALSAVDVRTRVLDAQTRGTITLQKANELLGVNGSNPYEALRELYLQLAIPVPAWLLPAPVACVTNCIDVQRDYSGAGTGQADLQINSPVSCHVIVEFTGNFTVHLTIHPNNTVNGTVSVNGTAKIIQIIQPSNPFCQLASLPISVNNAPITGTVDNMTATLSVAGFSGVLIGHITGNTLLGQVQTPAPESKVLLNFSLTPL